MTFVRSCQKLPPCPTEMMPSGPRQRSPSVVVHLWDNAFRKGKEVTAEKQLETEKTEVRTYE